MQCESEKPRLAVRALTLVLLTMLGPAVLAAPGDNHLMSLDAATNRAAGQGYRNASISDDGRIVTFDSYAATLVAGDTNGTSDVFVRDRTTGITERISIGVGGIEPNGGSLFPAVSGNGRYVAFRSWASNLVVGDTNHTDDVFVRDRVSGVTTRASVRPDGGQFTSPSFVSEGGVSDDGRYVVFFGYEGEGGIYVRDTVAHTTTRVTTLGDGPAPVISGNGRYVLYTQTAGPVYFVYDRTTGTKQVLAGKVTGPNPPDAWWRPAISRDGRWVAYASNLSEVAADTNGTTDVYLLDRATGEKRLASVRATGQQNNSFGISPDVSDDGRYVAFRSTGSLLSPDAPAGSLNLLVKDMQTGVVEFVAPVDSIDHESSLSGDGTALAFLTSTALLTTDLNTTADAYVHEVGASSEIPAVHNYYLRPRRIDFGNVQVSTAVVKGFALVNVGNRALTINTLELVGPNPHPFSLKSYCASPVPSGGRCWITVTFRPTTSGFKQARLHLVAGGIERYRALTGTGVAAP